MKILQSIFLTLFLITGTFHSNAQDYDHWAIDLGFGVHQVGAPLSAGYSANVLGQGSLGARYMFNEKFGLRLDLGYNKFSESKNTTPFSSNYYRASIEGVVNMGNILNFKTWTNRFNLLLHGGAGVAILNTIAPVKTGDDVINTLNFGITPQFQISNRIALFLDLSSVINYNQARTFNGGAVTQNRETNIALFNTSIGLSIAFGRNRQLADFWYEEESKEITDELQVIKNRLKKAETEIASLKVKESDTDKEKLITELDERYLKKDEVNKYSGTITSSNVDFIKELLNRGYVNVYFDVNKTSIQKESLYAVNYLKQFMLDNPYMRASLIGFADETGDENYNQKLSEKRAKTVYDILVAAGISPNRLSYAGVGEDNTMTNEARQLARKVAFRIN